MTKKQQISNILNTLDDMFVINIFDISSISFHLSYDLKDYVINTISVPKKLSCRTKVNNILKNQPISIQAKDINEASIKLFQNHMLTVNEINLFVRSITFFIQKKFGKQYYVSIYIKEKLDSFDDMKINFHECEQNTEKPTI